MRVKWGFRFQYCNCTATEIVRYFSPKITKSDSFQYELMTKLLVLVCISMGSRELVRKQAIFLVFFHRKSKVNKGFEIIEC